MGERAHRRLEVWRRSIQLVKKIDIVSNKFPSQARFGLSSQIMRSSISVPSNIAEGMGRHNDKEKLLFFNIAQGSLSELDTQVEIAYELNYLKKIIYDDLIDEVTLVSKKLYGLSRKIRIDLKLKF